jgi:hypothetical protein
MTTTRHEATLLSLFDMIAEPQPARDTIPCPHCRGCGRITATEPTHRSNDTATAKAAGQRQDTGTRFRRDSQQGRVLQALGFRDMTAQECALFVHGEQSALSAVEGTRRRVSSLRRLALIEPSGIERTNPGSQTPSVVWTLTDRGWDVLDVLEATGWSE